MKATLIMDDHVMLQLKEEAVRTGKRLAELVEAALRSMLDHRTASVVKDLHFLPSFRGGSPRVDTSDRHALYQDTEGR